MKAEFLHSRQLDKQAWDELINSSPQWSIFTISWYLDAILGDWQGILAYDENELVAVMPLNIRKKYFLTYSLQPVLARQWGICFKAESHKSSYKKYNWEHSIVKAMIEAIPPLFRFEHYFHPSFDYPLPFHWAHYKLAARYTYVIDLRKPFEEIEMGFAGSRRNLARKETGIRMSKDVEAHLQLLSANEKAGKLIMPQLLFEPFIRLFHASDAMGQCTILEAHSHDHGLEGSVILLHDAARTYFFSSVLNPGAHATHTMSALLLESLKISATHSQLFDFKGSMIEGIEFFFRSFGSIPQPYLGISRQKFTFPSKHPK